MSWQILCRIQSVIRKRIMKTNMTAIMSKKFAATIEKNSVSHLSRMTFRNFTSYHDKVECLGDCPWNCWSFEAVACKLLAASSLFDSIVLMLLNGHFSKSIKWVIFIFNYSLPCDMIIVVYYWVWLRGMHNFVCFKAYQKSLIRLWSFL